jgi:hypothetical protein
MPYGPEHRRRAAELGALDAKALIATIPGLLEVMTPAQVRQVQMVLDAAMLNPVLRKEADDAYKASVVAQSGNLVMRDPDKERRANKLYERMIPIDEWDKRIRLDYQKLLSADALTPVSNNPDEADYFGKVRTTLEQRGVWLRMGQPFSNDPNRTALTDPKRWEIWFSLGADGDAIPSGDRTIDQEELLKTTMLGAGYYRAVWTGPTQTKLKNLLKQLNNAYDAGWEEHIWLIQRQRDAPFLVAEISDFLGGADLPPLSIWNKPHQLILASLNANTAGDVITAQAQLLAAALAIEANCDKLRAYAEKSSSGAGRAVSILKVARTAGHVAEAGLLLTGVGIAFKTGRAGAVGVEAAAMAERKAIDEAATKVVTDYAKKAGISEAELSSVQVVRTPGGAGTKLGNMKGGHSAGYGKGWGEGW